MYLYIFFCFFCLLKYKKNMLLCSKNSEETYHNVINTLLDDIKNFQVDEKYYFLIKQKQLESPFFFIM